MDTCGQTEHSTWQLLTALGRLTLLGERQGGGDSQGGDISQGGVSQGGGVSQVGGGSQGGVSQKNPPTILLASKLSSTLEMQVPDPKLKYTLM